MKGLLEDVMPVERWPYRKNGEIHYTSCRLCAGMLDDEARYGDYERERSDADS